MILKLGQISIISGKNFSINTSLSIFISKSLKKDRIGQDFCTRRTSGKSITVIKSIATHSWNEIQGHKNFNF